MILTINMNAALDKVYSINDFKTGGIFRPDDMTATAGGKGLNAARVASILGQDVTAAGLIGGSTGSFIEEEVKRQGIKSEFVRIKGESRVCIAVMDKKNNNSTEILEPGPHVSEEECEVFLKHYRSLLDKFDVVAASGSLPQGVPEDFYYTLVTEAKNRSKTFILDTSGIYFKYGVEAHPYMIKPNLEEMEKVLGRKIASMKEKAEVLISFKEKGVALPCMTLGKDGCLAVFDDGVYQYYAPPLNAVNTVGSGDSFVAGCAAAFDRGMEQKDAIRLGMACGMANTQYFKTGMVSVELVEKYIESIKTKKL